MIFEKKVIKIYSSMMLNRCDDNGNVFYFSAEDFPGIEKESFSFTSSKGHILQGYFYSYPDAKKNRLVIFEHGMGGGHRSYMKEIEKLCMAGYRVLAYDHTGCMESGGENTGGLSQSLCDLNDLMNTLKNDEVYKDYDISVVGHSWGGFSAMNISSLYPEISHIVVMSGFVSVEKMINSFFSGPLKFYRKCIMDIEQRSNPQFVNIDGVDTLKKTESEVLLIYSDNDTLCKKEVHFDELKNELSGKSNIKFILENNKGHNPNFTENAVKYKDEFFGILTKKTKKKQLETKEEKETFRKAFDWHKMTEQDEKVWGKILTFLD
ncbi:MAG: alpha/beta fold hydrolase [Clostridia bacterium]|nr:alpha/beta fold hydrolase [Clostridia bacterium]